MQKLRKKQWWRTFFTASVLLTVTVAWPLSSALAATESDYPSKPVRLMIAFAPGGSTDVVGRLIASKLSERLGKQFVTENLGGAGGNIAAERVARSAPDGYTLLFHSSGIILNPLLEKAPYDPFNSFIPLAKLGGSVSTVVVHPSVPANSLQELITLAKKEPGKLIAAASGVGGYIHLATEFFKEAAGIDFKIVQFKSGGEAIIDMLGGHSQLFVGTLQPSLPHVQSGKMRALAYGAKQRSRLLPDVPTVTEAGVPGYEASIWWGLFAPAGTPSPIVDKLSSEIGAIMKTPEMIKLLEDQGAELDLLTGTAFTNFMQVESAKWGKVIKENNIVLGQ